MIALAQKDIDENNQAVEKPIASFFIEIKQVVRMQYSKAPRKLYAQHTNPPLLVSQQPFFV
jgi:hypothetical protein